MIPIMQSTISAKGTIPGEIELVVHEYCRRGDFLRLSSYSIGITGS